MQSIFTVFVPCFANPQALHCSRAGRADSSDIYHSKACVLLRIIAEAQVSSRVAVSHDSVTAKQHDPESEIKDNAGYNYVSMSRHVSSIQSILEI